MAGKVQTRIERLVGDADTFGYGKTGIEGFGIGFGSGCRTLFDKRNITGFFRDGFPEEKRAGIARNRKIEWLSYL